MKFHAMILAMTCAVSLGGCTHLLNPYQLHSASGLYAACGSSTENRERAEKTVLGEVCSTSTALQKKYIEAAGQHERARNLTGTGLLAGAAYAGLMGVSEGIGPANAEDQIAAIASVSALGLGWTSLFTSPRRQDVYIAGVEAISCVQRRAAPFDIRDEDMNILELAMYGTGNSDSLEDLIAFVKDDDPHDALVREAETVLSDSRLLMSQLNGTAAADMRYSLVKIDAAVMRELRKSQPDLQSIKGLSDSLPQIAAGFGQSAEVPAEAAEGATGTAVIKLKDFQNLTSSDLGALDGLIGIVNTSAQRKLQLQRRVLRLRSIASSVKAGIEAAGRMTDCGLEAAVVGMEAIPGKLTFTAGMAEEKIVTVTHGEAPFTAYFPSAPAGLAPRLLSAYNRTITIVASDDTEAGTALLLIVDKSGIPIEVQVTIDAP